MTVDTIERRPMEAHPSQPQLAVATTWSAEAAHDLINYLSIVDSYVDLLLRDADPGDEIHLMLTQTDTAVDKCILLARNLLILNLGAERRSEELCINDIVASSAGMLRHLVGKHIELTIDCAPSVGLVRVDRQEMERVLLNLVTNACQAIPGTGAITLQTANVQVDRVDKSTDEPTQYVTIAVSDTGRGIDAELLPHLFEPFFTTRKEGTGMGLAIVHDIVDRNNGRIRVESEPGCGTTFRIYLPRIDDDSTAGRHARA